MTTTSASPTLTACPRPDVTLARVVTCTLPKDEWTHEAHIAAATALVRRAGVARAHVLMARLISRLNVSHGTANTDTSGYHETLTGYYVRAIGSLVTAGLTDAAIVAHSATGREAPLRHWRRETLFGVEARRTMVAPDLCALPEAFVTTA
jgi:hypothetical protein